MLKAGGKDRKRRERHRKREVKGGGGMGRRKFDGEILLHTNH